MKVAELLKAVDESDMKTEVKEDLTDVWNILNEQKEVKK